MALEPLPERLIAGDPDAYFEHDLLRIGLAHLSRALPVGLRGALPPLYGHVLAVLAAFFAGA
jgi:hypothetical protein